MTYNTRKRIIALFSAFTLVFGVFDTAFAGGQAVNESYGEAFFEDEYRQKHK